MRNFNVIRGPAGVQTLKPGSPDTILSLCLKVYGNCYHAVSHNIFYFHYAWAFKITRLSITWRYPILKPNSSFPLLIWFNLNWIKLLEPYLSLIPIHTIIRSTDNSTIYGDSYLRQCESASFAQRAIRAQLSRRGTDTTFNNIQCDYDGTYGTYEIINGL